MATRLRIDVGLVTTPIACIADVERLMKLADKVLDPEKRLEALGNGPTAITKDSKLPSVPFDNGMPILAGRQLKRKAHRNIGIVPGGCRGKPVVMFRPDTVRPGRTVFE